jgi:hypothetical protein
VGPAKIMGLFQSARGADLQLSLQKPSKREQNQSALCKSVSVVGELLIDGLCGAVHRGRRADPVSAKGENDPDGKRGGDSIPEVRRGEPPPSAGACQLSYCTKSVV